ncbi:MAG: response regulator [Sterolibacteriaceae bacterium MAG5]|nr:response regulator [Candidatus Nitricoxidireducens bremensis]
MTIPERAQGRPRLLIIDDQPESVGLLLSYLKGRELDILVALDGEDGIGKATAGQPELILLDITMPGLDGLSVCRRLKADPRTAEIPVVFLSASGTIEDKLQGFAAGAIDYITKPFFEEEVVARVFVHLQTRQQMARLEAMALTRAMSVEGDGTRSDGDCFNAAVALLQEHMADAPRLAEIAQRLEITERRLTDIFRRRTGMTVFDYFVEMRLETARRLLEGGQMQVQLIADQVGYRNPGDFTRAFRNRYGVSPREYRRACGPSFGSPV